MSTQQSSPTVPARRVAAAEAAPSRLAKVLRRRPRLFAISCLLLLACGTLFSGWQSVTYAVRARVIRRVRPLVADSAGGDWKALLQMDRDATHQQALLSRRSLKRSLRQAGLVAAAAGRSDSAYQEEELIEFVRRHAKVTVSRPSELLGVVQLELVGLPPQQLIALAKAMASNYVEDQIGRLRDEVEQACQVTRQQCQVWQDRIRELAVVHRIKSLERDLADWDNQLHALQTVLRKLKEQQGGRTELAGAGASSGGAVARKWAPVLAVEREIYQMKLTPQERRRMTSWLNQLRRSWTNDGRAPAEIMAAVSGGDNGSGQMLDIERELELKQQQASRARGELERLRAAVPRAPDPSLTLALVQEQLDEARRKASALEAKASELTAARSALVNRQAVAYEVELPPPSRRMAPVRFALLMLLVAAVAVGVAWCLAWLVDIRDTAFHSVAEAKAHLTIPVLGAVPAPHLFGLSRPSEVRAPGERSGITPAAP